MLTPIQSLAYEVAPFNIKMTIVQPNLEIPVLTNKITSVPPLPDYSADVNPAPLSRDIIGGLLDRLNGVYGTGEDDMATPMTSVSSAANLMSPNTTTMSETSPHDSSQPLDTDGTTASQTLHSQNISSLYPTLQPQLKDALIAETVFAIAAIGGHENPPARHIVGFEGVLSVKEKLKTVSEELEDFIDVSCVVDIGKDGMARLEEGVSI
jgi:hypothetical protein